MSKVRCRLELLFWSVSNVVVHACFLSRLAVYSGNMFLVVEIFLSGVWIKVTGLL